MSEVIQADYEMLETIAGIFGQESGRVEQLTSRLSHRLEELSSHWQGMGAEAFFSEMADDVMPATGRLHEALVEAEQATVRIALLIQEAEDDARNLFKDVGGGVTGGGTPPGTPGPTPTPEPAPNPQDQPWAAFVGKTSNRMQGWGCVAHTLNNHYLPWVTPSVAPGNAADFIGKAQQWAQANPQYGVTIDRTPRPGAICVFPNWAGGLGHVATVTEVNGGNFVYESANTWDSNGDSAPQGQWYNSKDQLNGVDHYSASVATGGQNDVWFIHLPWSEQA